MRLRKLRKEMGTYKRTNKNMFSKYNVVYEADNRKNGKIEKEAKKIVFTEDKAVNEAD